MRAFIILAILGLAACSPGRHVPLHVARELGSETRTVLSGAEALKLTHQCSRASPGPVSGQWTPSADDLDAFDVPLTDVLRGQLLRAGVTAAPRDYDRQFAGFIVNGRRVIYVNGFNRSTTDNQPNTSFDWHTQAVAICDGGPITFGAEFDAETHQVTKFAFNGAV
ncbi:MAG: hypothetical protein QM759_11345 [Terricaulis sp.]